jgi:hypothetical protein
MYNLSFFPSLRLESFLGPPRQRVTYVGYLLSNCCAGIEPKEEWIMPRKMIQKDNLLIHPEYRGKAELCE